MKRRRKLFLGAVLTAMVLIVGAMVTSMIRRSGQPKFEGKTAEEWIEHHTRRVVAGGGAAPGTLGRKELKAAFTALGDEVVVEQVSRYVAYWDVNAGTGTAEFYNWFDWIPAKHRPMITIDPMVSQHVRSAVLSEVSAPWDQLETIVTSLDDSKGGQPAGAKFFIAWCSDGSSSNAVPYLLKAKSSGFADRNFYWSAWFKMGSHAIHGLPMMLDEIRRNGILPLQTQCLVRLGPLESKFNQLLLELFDKTDSVDQKKEFAAVLLFSDPGNVEAYAFLEEYLREAGEDGDYSWSELGFLSQLGSDVRPNPDVARLAEMSGELSDYDNISSHLMLQHCPEKVLPILHDRLGLYGTMLQPKGRQVSVQRLLEHNPRDPKVVEFLEARLRDRSQDANLRVVEWISYLQFMYSDTPGVPELLDLADSVATSQQARQAVQEARRHVELNDLLLKPR